MTSRNGERNVPARHSGLRSSGGFRPLAQQRHVQILSRLTDIGTVQVSAMAELTG